MFYLTLPEMVMLGFVGVCVICIYLLLIHGTPFFTTAAPPPQKGHSASPKKSKRKKKAVIDEERNLTAEFDEEEEEAKQAPMKEERLHVREAKWNNVSIEQKAKITKTEKLSEDLVEKDLRKGFVPLGYKSDVQIENEKRAKEIKVQQIKEAEEKESKKRQEKRKGKKEKVESTTEEKKVWEKSLADLGITHDVKELDGTAPADRDDEPVVAVAEPEEEETGPKGGKGGKGKKEEKATGEEKDDKPKKQAAKSISKAGREFLAQHNKEKAAAEAARRSTFSKVTIAEKVVIEEKTTKADTAESSSSSKKRGGIKSTPAPWAGLSTKQLADGDASEEYPTLVTDSTGNTGDSPSKKDESLSNGSPPSSNKKASGIYVEKKPRKPAADGILAVVAAYMKDPDSIDRALTPEEWAEYKRQVLAKKTARQAKANQQAEKEHQDIKQQLEKIQEAKKAESNNNEAPGGHADGKKKYVEKDSTDDDDEAAKKDAEAAQKKKEDAQRKKKEAEDKKKKDNEEKKKKDNEEKEAEKKKKQEAEKKKKEEADQKKKDDAEKARIAAEKDAADKAAADKVAADKAAAKKKADEEAAEKKRQEDEKRKAEERRKQEEADRKAAEDKAKKQEEAKKEAARKEEEKRKKEADAAATAAEKKAKADADKKQAEEARKERAQAEAVERARKEFENAVGKVSSDEKKVRNTIVDQEGKDMTKILNNHGRERQLAEAKTADRVNRQKRAADEAVAAEKKAQDAAAAKLRAEQGNARANLEANYTTERSKTVQAEATGWSELQTSAARSATAAKNAMVTREAEQRIALQAAKQAFKSACRDLEQEEVTTRNSILADAEKRYKLIGALIGQSQTQAEAAYRKRTEQHQLEEDRQRLMQLEMELDRRKQVRDQLQDDETAARDRLTEEEHAARTALKCRGEESWVDFWRKQQDREERERVAAQAARTNSLAASGSPKSSPGASPVASQGGSSSGSPSARPTVGFSLLDTVDINNRDMITVTNVNEGTPSGNAGIQEGDTLISYNGLPITTVDQFRGLYAQARRGDNIAIIYSRPNEHGERVEHETTMRL